MSEIYKQKGIETISTKEKKMEKIILCINRPMSDPPFGRQWGVTSPIEAAGRTSRKLTLSNLPSGFDYELKLVGVTEDGKEVPFRKGNVGSIFMSTEPETKVVNFKCSVKILKNGILWDVQAAKEVPHDEWIEVPIVFHRIS